LKQSDRFYFEWAIKLAHGAFENGYSPVGAILVAGNGVKSPASSKREIGNVFHAEFLAMHHWQRHQIKPPYPYTLYSTLEPCIMCSGMAAVMKVARIKWLVDDIWAGASRVYNPDNAYIQKRFPTMEKIDIPHLHQEALEMWVKYLRETGHADAVSFMLGLPEDYQCK
jgi:tRNA(adenine34) deaminase